MATLVFLIVAALVIGLLIMIFAVLSGILHHLKSIDDNAHVTRAGVNSMRARIRQGVTVLDRLESHIRGPSRRPVAAASIHKPTP